MHKHIVFKNTQHSSLMEDHANEQLKKIEDFLASSNIMDHAPGGKASEVPDSDASIYINLVIEPSKTRAHHHMELRVKGPGYDLISEHEGAEPYEVLDHVIDVMYRNLHEYKQKEVDMRKSRGRHDEFKKQR
jgi:ribosome-associated translation inhibitor RaiA